MLQMETVGSMSRELCDSPIQICLLGSFRVLNHGQAIAIRSGGKVESLLYQLSLHRREGVSREALLDRLWPESDTSLAGQSLNSLVYSVRQLFGETLGGASLAVQRDGCYQLNLEAGIDVDVARFEELLDRGERARTDGDSETAARVHHQAVDLYRGDLHGDESIHAIIERERLRARYLTLLVQLASHYYERGHYATCLDLALRLLRRDPCREDAHRLVMRCHVRLGERAQALRQYRVCGQVLRADFDGEPEPETRALYELIRVDPASV